MQRQLVFFYIAQVHHLNLEYGAPLYTINVGQVGIIIFI